MAQMDRRLVFIGLPLLLLLILPSVREPETGVLFGRVTDQDGKPIENASLDARNEARLLTLRASTDLHGMYRIDQVPPGRYAVFAQAPGHHTKGFFGVFVEKGQEVQIDFILPCCVSD